MKRFASISSPNTTLIVGVLALKPAKAEPLLPPADVAAYSTSENPCTPGLFRAVRRRQVEAHMIPAPTGMSSGVVMHRITAMRISFGPIFLPGYSGVRPWARR